MTTNDFGFWNSYPSTKHIAVKFSIRTEKNAHITSLNYPQIKQLK